MSYERDMDSLNEHEQPHDTQVLMLHGRIKALESVINQVAWHSQLCKDAPDFRIPEYLCEKIRLLDIKDRPTMSEKNDRIHSLEAEVKELKQALTGRTVSCSQCNEMGRKAEQAEKDIRTLQDTLLESEEELAELQKQNTELREMVESLEIDCSIVRIREAREKIKEQREIIIAREVSEMEMKGMLSKSHHIACNFHSRIVGECNCVAVMRKDYKDLESQNARLREALEKVTSIATEEDIENWADMGSCPCYDGASGEECICSEEARRITAKHYFREAKSCLQQLSNQGEAK